MVLQRKVISTQMTQTTIDKEPKILLMRVEDMRARVDKIGIPAFIGFLGTAEISYVSSSLASSGCNYRFYGGYEDSDRCFLGIFPEGEVDVALFPIYCVKCSYRAGESLTHRDFLGSLMGLQLKREAVGDICVMDNEAYLFLTEHAANAAVAELNKIGRVGVKTSMVDITEFLYTPNFAELTTSLSSLRLDCVIAYLGNRSRSSAATAISQGLVAVNGIYITKTDKTIKEGDKISVRGTGKFIFDGQAGVSKKNKLRLKFRKYQ